jgi:hypothetical protein
MKICSKCKLNRDNTDFEYCKHTTTKLSAWCKKCISIKKAEKYKLNKEKYLLNSKEYYKNNKKLKSEYVKEYQNKNKIKLNKYRNQYNKDRKLKDSSFKLSFILRCRLLDALKKNNITKKHSANYFLGCSLIECKQHLESQFKPEMNWENHGNIWEIDHIKPCSSFDLIDLEQQKQCFHYTNLQPLFKTTKIAENFGYVNEVGNRNKLNKIICQ